jgi:hypothetical protein
MSDQQQESAGGDDLSGLTGFFFYAFIVHPMTAWILRPGRFERKKSIMYAIAFLAALASIKTGTDRTINRRSMRLRKRQRRPRHTTVYETVGRLSPPRVPNVTVCPSVGTTAKI